MANTSGILRTSSISSIISKMYMEMKGSGTTMAMTATGKNKELGRDGKFSLLKWLQCTCSYSRSTKDVFCVPI